jgi:hypothetical protein
VVSTTATASTTGPPVGPMVGASTIAAAAARITVRDNLTIAASSCGAVASLRGSTGVGTSTGLSQQLGSNAVTAEVRVATCCFVVAVPGGGGWVTLLSTRMK